MALAASGCDQAHDPAEQRVIERLRGHRIFRTFSLAGPGTVAVTLKEYDFRRRIGLLIAAGQDRKGLWKPATYKQPFAPRSQTAAFPRGGNAGKSVSRMPQIELGFPNALVRR